MSKNQDRAPGGGSLGLVLLSIVTVGCGLSGGKAASAPQFDTAYQAVLPVAQLIADDQKKGSK